MRKAVPFEKVHSLTYLLDLCEFKKPGFPSLREGAEALTPYAIEVRYPGEVMEVSPEEAQEALATAKQCGTSSSSSCPARFTYNSRRKLNRERHSYTC